MTPPAFSAMLSGKGHRRESPRQGAALCPGPISHRPPPSPPLAAAPEPPREPVRRLCDGLLPRPRGIQSNPEQPEPPMNAAALQRLWSARGSGGRHSLAFPPAALRFPACVSLRLPQASLRDCMQSLSLVAQSATYFSTRESGLVPRLRSAIASNCCRSSTLPPCLAGKPCVRSLIVVKYTRRDLP